MNPTCKAETVHGSYTYKCKRSHGHSGNHDGWSFPNERLYHSWQQSPADRYSPGGFIPTTKPTEATLGYLTAVELKIMAYALSSFDPDDEVEAALAAKVDKALKAVL